MVVVPRVQASAVRRPKAGVARSASATAEVFRDSHQFKATLRNGFSLHAPMVALALERLGASEAEILAQFSRSREKNGRYGLIPIAGEDLGHLEGDVSEANWLQLCNSSGLGEKSFRDFWFSKIGGQGVVESARLCFAALSPDGTHSRLHHGVIRLAYAVQGGTEEEVAAALAAYSVNYDPLVPFVWSPSSFHSPVEALRHLRSQGIPQVTAGTGKKYARFLKDPQVLSNVPRLSGLGTKQGLGDFVTCVLLFYITKPNIFTLHLITGLHALIVLKDVLMLDDKVSFLLCSALTDRLPCAHSRFFSFCVFQSFEAALLSHWVSVVVMYYSHKCVEIDTGIETAPPPRSGALAWEEVVRGAIQKGGDHDIKFADTLVDLKSRYPDLETLLLRAASA